MTRLSDDMVTLRAMEPDDAQILYKWENDTSLWSVSDTISPFSKKALELYIESSVTSFPEQIRLMVDFDGRTVGCVDIFSISQINHNASLGILIYDTTARGCGVSDKAISLLENFAYNSLELKSLKAEVSKGNRAAESLFRRSGYREVGTLKGWKRDGYGIFSDVIIFQHELR